MSQSGGSVPYGAIAQAAGDVLGFVGSMITNNQIKKQNEGQRDHEIRMWEMQNAYNTPLAQRQRLEAAGFNPNLMYGSPPANTASPVSTSKPTAPTPLDMPDPAKVINQYQDFKLANASLAESEKRQDLMDMQTLAGFKNMAMTDQKINESAARTEGLKWDAAEKARQHTFNTRMEGNAINYASAVTRNVMLRNMYQEIQNMQLPEKHEAELQRIASQLTVDASTMSKIDFEKRLIAANLRLRERGLTEHDSFFFRYFADFLPQGSKVLNQINNAYEGADKLRNSPFNPLLPVKHAISKFQTR